MGALSFATRRRDLAALVRRFYSPAGLSGHACQMGQFDLDMTSSELSRKLGDNPNDPVNFPLHMLPDLIRATGDKRPVYWLVESFLEDPAAKRHRAMAQIADLLPQLQALMKAAGTEPALKAVA